MKDDQKSESLGDSMQVEPSSPQNHSSPLKSSSAARLMREGFWWTMGASLAALFCWVTVAFVPPPPEPHECGWVSWAGAPAFKLQSRHWLGADIPNDDT